MTFSATKMTISSALNSPIGRLVLCYAGATGALFLTIVLTTVGSGVLAMDRPIPLPDWMLEVMAVSGLLLLLLSYAAWALVVDAPVERKVWYGVCVVLVVLGVHFIVTNVVQLLALYTVHLPVMSAHPSSAQVHMQEQGRLLGFLITQQREREPHLVAIAFALGVLGACALLVYVEEMARVVSRRWQRTRAEGAATSSISAGAALDTVRGHASVLTIEDPIEVPLRTDQNHYRP